MRIFKNKITETIITPIIMFIITMLPLYYLLGVDIDFLICCAPFLYLYDLLIVLEGCSK